MSFLCCLRPQDEKTNEHLSSNLHDESAPPAADRMDSTQSEMSAGSFGTEPGEALGITKTSSLSAPAGAKPGHSRGGSRFGKPPSAKGGGRGGSSRNSLDTDGNEINPESAKSYMSPEDKAAEWQRMTAELLEKFNPTEIIQQVPLLASLSRQQSKKLIRGLRRQDFEVDECLMREGEEGDSFYIIVKGRVEVSTAEAGPVAVLESGDYAGEQALLRENATRNATLRAIERTVCLACNKRTFDAVLNNVRFVTRKAVLTKAPEEYKMDDDGEHPDDETVDWLLGCVQDNLLFLNLDRDQREAVVRCMILNEVPAGHELITQGDQNADTFYVTESGAFDVLVEGMGKVLDYTRGGGFGELALLYDNPRAATVVATEDSRVWVVKRAAFRHQLQETYRRKNEDINNFLTGVTLFQPLLTRERRMVADSLEEMRYEAGTVIFQQGDVGENFYVIKEGIVTWSKDNGESGDLEPLMFFGERALRTEEARAATITCKTDCVLLEMGGQHFQALLGPVLELIDDKIATYRRNADADSVASPRPTDENKDQTIDENVCALAELETVGLLGRGAFGTVTLVVDPNTGKSYALKAISIEQIIQLGQQEHIKSEKEVMEMMNCPFLVNLRATYSDPKRVYLLLDACLGGELFTILRQDRYFDENRSRFCTSCVVEAFDYMHKRDIIYRDLKPENLVLTSNGYLKVTDFGFAKVVRDKTFTLCGTPDYLAPEIVTGQGHGKAVDWWTLGVLIYEMLASFPPFFDDEPIETYRKIIKGRIKFPRYFSQEARDLIRGLLRSKPMKRLGILKGGAQNIRNHPWFYGFDWQALQRQEMPGMPIKIPVANARDLSNFTNAGDDDDGQPIDNSNKDWRDDDAGGFAKEF